MGPVTIPLHRRDEKWQGRLQPRGSSAWGSTASYGILLLWTSRHRPCGPHWAPSYPHSKLLFCQDGKSSDLPSFGVYTHCLGNFVRCNMHKITNAVEWTAASPLVFKGDKVQEMLHAYHKALYQPCYYHLFLDFSHLYKEASEPPGGSLVAISWGAATLGSCSVSGSECAKQLHCSDAFTSENSPMRGVLWLLAFLRWGNWGPEWITQLRSNKVRIQTQICLSPKSEILSLIPCEKNGAESWA